MIITFSDVGHFKGWSMFPSFIQELVISNSSRRICEVGAGANPAVSQEFAREHGLLYRPIDKSVAEINKSGFEESSVFDICAPGAKLPEAPYDLICSRMCAEHFTNSTKAYENMLESLSPGGLCVHSFATLYTLPFLLNRIFPDSLSDYILERVQPERDRDKHDKFSAYYSHCRGPLKSQIRFFQEIGYEVLEYHGHFGHNYYHLRLPLLDFLEKKKSQLLLKVPVASLTSYSTIILRRPYD